MKAQAFGHTGMAQHLPMARSRRLVSHLLRHIEPAVVLVALFLGTGYAREEQAGVVRDGPPPLNEDIRFQLGTVALASNRIPARFGYDTPRGQIAASGDRAQAAASDLLSTTTPDPLASAVVGIGAFALAPVAAAEGALGARKRLNPQQLSECEARLSKALGEMAEPHWFHDCLLKAASNTCPKRLMALDPAHPAPLQCHRPDVVLDSRVEELRLERRGSSDTSYRLRIRTRTRLLKGGNEAILYDQFADYQSDSCLFLDWTLHGAIRGVAETGYRKLAQQIIQRTLETRDQPLLTGAGYSKTVASRRKAPGSSPGPIAGPRHSAIEQVSFPVAGTQTLGIFATTDIERIVLQSPLTRGQAVAQAPADVEWMLDGLDKHPNLLVALPASAAAVPVSLCKQGVAAVRGVSPGKLRLANEKLNAVAEQAVPHEEVALRVAQQLEALTSQPLLLIRQHRPGIADGDADSKAQSSPWLRAGLPRGQNAGDYRAGREIGTALEIRVQNAELSGSGTINPKLALRVEAQVTLSRLNGDPRTYSCPVRYLSRSHTFAGWAARDAKLLWDELQECYRALSTAVVDQTVGRGLLPGDDSPRAAFAQSR